jgi:hypothetical protein
MEGIMETKVCPQCKIEQALTSAFYYRDKYKNNGFSSQCKKCVLDNQHKNKQQIKTRSAQYYIENKDALNKKNKLWKTNNPEKYKLQKTLYALRTKEIKKGKSKVYSELNKEKLKVRARIYYEKNKEECKRRTKKWHEEHREVKVISTQRYRSKKKELLATLTTEYWNRIRLYFDNKCAYCGKELPLVREHFIAANSGGEYTHNNIVTSCQICNLSKNRKDFFEWYPKYKYYSKTREKQILKYLGYNNGTQQLEMVETKLLNPSLVYNK